MASANGTLGVPSLSESAESSSISSIKRKRDDGTDGSTNGLSNSHESFEESQALVRDLIDVLKLYVLDIIPRRPFPNTILNCTGCIP
jgi:hypothetical protein